MKAYRTCALIETVIASTAMPIGSERDRYLLRQSLLGLVRAAKAEQIAVAKATRRRLTTNSRNATRAVFRKASARDQVRQREFSFD